jgi:hypothetical protein
MTVESHREAPESSARKPVTGSGPAEPLGSIMELGHCAVGFGHPKQSLTAVPDTCGGRRLAARCCFPLVGVRHGRVPGGRAEIAAFVGLHGDNSKVDAALLNRDGDVRVVGDRTGKPFNGSDPAKPPEPAKPPARI